MSSKLLALSLAFAIIAAVLSVEFIGPWTWGRLCAVLAWMVCAAIATLAAVL